MATVRASVTQFLQSVPKDVKVGVVSFADKPNLDVAPTTDHGAVQAAVDGLKSSGDTALYDGLNLAIDTLGAAGDRSILDPQRRQGHHQLDEGPAGRAETEGVRHPDPGHRLQDQLHRQPGARVPRRRRSGRIRHRRREQRGRGERLLLGRQGARQPGVLVRPGAGSHREQGRPAARDGQRQVVHRDRHGRLRRGAEPRRLPRRPRRPRRLPGRRRVFRPPMRQRPRRTPR